MAKIGHSYGQPISEKDFGHLFSRCRPLFVKIADSYIHDTATAEDITDESFVKFWEKREELQTENYEAYIFKSVVNRCLDHLKSVQIKLKATQDIHDVSNRMQMYEINSLKGCDPDRLFAEEIETLFRECVNNMPDITRKIFIASRFEDKTYGEIAAQMNIPVRQVTYHIQVALRILRQELKDYIPVLFILGLIGKGDFWGHL